MTSDILVFSPPAPKRHANFGIGEGLSEVCGWLRDEGYGFDQKSLFVECAYRNRYRFRRDFIDLSVFKDERLIDYLRGGEDEEIVREVDKLGEFLDMDSYDIIIVPAPSEMIASQRDFRLMMALPILKEKANDQTVIVGGMNIRDDMDVIGLPYIDYVINGEMEIPLTNILSHELENQSLKIDPGIICEKDGNIMEGEPYQHPVDRKSRPYFNKEILEKYAEISALNKSILPYQLGRGCSQDCNFCPLFEDQKFQYKSVDKVVSELKELKNETGVTNVWFKDRNLFNDPDYIKELAEELKKEDLGISWTGMSIIVPRDQEFFDTLAEGGCVALQHGIESASNSVLHRMQKHQTRRMIESTLEKEYKAGIKPYAFLMTNFVDETWDEYFETVDFVKKNPHLMAATVNNLTLYSTDRQPLYREADKFDIEVEENDKNWMDRSLHSAVSYSNKGKNGDWRVNKLRKRYLQRISDLELYLKNFGRDQPLNLLKMQLNKILYKDYNDMSYYYV